MTIEKSITDGILTKITKELQKKKWVEIERIEIKLEGLSQKGNLYIMVDEAHRSHYGFLVSFMRTVLPKAKFIAFTGTPISKEDKSILGEFYGGDYIDVYTIKESVADGATVELLYDEGIAKLDVKKKKRDYMLLNRKWLLVLVHLNRMTLPRIILKPLNGIKIIPTLFCLFEQLWETHAHCTHLQKSTISLPQNEYINFIIL